MPLSPDEQRIADRLAGLYRTTETRILDQLADATTSPVAKARLRDLLVEVRSETGALRTGTRSWLSTDLPAAYAAGATHAASTLGAVFSWTQTHREAAQALAAQHWADVGAHLREVETSTLRGIRRLLDDEVRRQILEGTPRRGDLARAIQRETGVATVRYADRSRHSIADYGDTLARTATATVRNTGEFNLSRQEGVTYMQATDGADCGLTAHNDPVKADGLVLPIDEAESYPIAHPRCARSWSPMPHVRTLEEAEEARLYSDEEAAERAAAERARAAASNVDGHPRGTFAREPRQARTAREARPSRI